MLVSIIVKAYKSAFCLFEHLHQTPFVTTPGATCMARNTLVMNILLHLPPAPGRVLLVSCVRWFRIRFHCAHFPVDSAPSGHSTVPPRTVFQALRPRWSRKQTLLVHICRISVPSGHSTVPPRTVFQALRPRRSRKHFLLVHIRRISVPSGNSTVPPCTVFLLLRPRWSRKHTHCAHFHRTSLCGSAGTTLLAFHAFYH